MLAACSGHGCSKGGVGGGGGGDHAGANFPDHTSNTQM